MKELLKKFEVFEPIHIVGDDDEVTITTYSNKCPETNTDYLVNNGIYRVESILDVTTDEEFEEGLSYIEFKVIKQ
jgi:hypothetical protein